MKTYTATPDDITHEWHIVDAAGVPLGRLASVVAQLIRGKHKPTYTPHMDGGDFVVVVNASKVRLTGRKEENKTYFSHTGYMGHERHTSARETSRRASMPRVGASSRSSSSCRPTTRCSA
jgi:large subunit ribosomal protein L13